MYIVGLREYSDTLLGPQEPPTHRVGGSSILSRASLGISKSQVSRICQELDEVVDGFGGVVAHASHALDFEVDPVRPQGWPPFGIEQISGDGPHPRWLFHKRSQDDWVLQYPPAYPLYRALEASPGQTGSQLAGVSAFVVDVCAEGIIEWAMEPLHSGDRSRLDELLSGTPSGADPERWEDFCDKMRELAELPSYPERINEYARLVRDCAARSLSLFEERG